MKATNKFLISSLLTLMLTSFIGFQNCARSGKIPHSQSSNNRNNSANQSAPEIVTQPASQAVTRGTAFSLYVEATGSDLDYEWYRNDVLVSGASDSVLNIAAAADDNIGSYRVHILNSLGEVLSDAAVVTISSGSTGTPSLITVPPTNQVALMNQPVVFTVQAVGSGLTYQWFMGTTAIAGQTNPTLVISSANASYYDQSFYVKVTSGSTTVESNHVQMIFQFQSVSVGRSCGPGSDKRVCKADGASEIQLNGNYICRSLIAGSAALNSQRIPIVDRSVASIRPDDTWFLDNQCNSCRYTLSQVNCFK